MTFTTRESVAVNVLTGVHSVPQWVESGTDVQQVPQRLVVGHGWGLFLARAIVVRLVASCTCLETASKILTDTSPVGDAQVRLSCTAFSTLKAFAIADGFDREPVTRHRLQVRRQFPGD